MPVSNGVVKVEVEVQVGSATAAQGCAELPNGPLSGSSRARCSPTSLVSRTQAVGPASCGASRTGSFNTLVYEEGGGEVWHVQRCQKHVGGIERKGSRLRHL